MSEIINLKNKIDDIYYDNENTTLQQNIEQIDKMLDKFIEIN